MTEKSDQSQWDLEQFDTDSVDEYLSRNQPEGVELSFTDLVVHLGKGEGKQAAEKIGAAVRQALVSQVGTGSRMLGQVVLLGVLGAVFSGFAGIFPSGQLSETGFFVTYLTLFTCLSASFFQSIQIASGVLNHLLEFMKALPAFFYP